MTATVWERRRNNFATRKGLSRESVAAARKSGRFWRWSEPGWVSRSFRRWRANMDWKRELFTAPWTAPGPNARLRWRFRASENRLVELWSFQNSYGILAFQGHRKRMQLHRHHPSKHHGLAVHKQSGGISCIVSRPFERRNYPAGSTLVCAPGK
jgi:hypothetical protein